MRINFLVAINDRLQRFVSCCQRITDHWLKVQRLERQNGRTAIVVDSHFGRKSQFDSRCCAKRWVSQM